MRGKKSNKSVTAETKGRAKYRCPAELARLIDLVNSVPPDRELPHIQDLLKECEGDKGRFVDAMIEKLAGVPESFTQPSRFDNWRIGHGSLDLADYIASGYMHFRRLRTAVRKMAQLSGLSESNEGRAQRMVELFLSSSELSIAAELDIDDRTGLITLRRDERLSALIGVQADRLRECEICRLVFWARQDNMVACSARCSAANRQRRLRERRSQYDRSKRKKP